MIRNTYLSFKVHFLSFFRNKNAFFWELVFPLFIYVIFYTIFGSFNDEGYSLFLLTGVLGMTLTADGLFGVGPVIKMNYENGTIRVLKKLPINIVLYFSGLIINRFIILSILYILLNLVSFLMSGMFLPIEKTPQVFLGIFLGLWIFSFLGLSLSFLNIKTSSEKGMNNILYFIILFTSNALYNISAFNPGVEKIANFLPLNGVLHILRSEQPEFLGLVLWMVIPVFLFYYAFNKVQYSR